MTDIAPGPVIRTRVVPGPLNVNPVGESPTIAPASVVRRRVVPGPLAPAQPQLVGPLEPGSVVRARKVPGPWIPVPDPSAPPLPAGPGEPVVPPLPPGIAIVDYPLTTDAQVIPKKNDIGTANFTVVRPGPEIDEEVGIDVLGRRVFTGLVTQTDDTQVDLGEAASELIKVSLEGMLVEFDRVRVLPDFGSRYTPYLGRPLQDARSMDWHMDRIGAPGNDILPPLNFKRAMALDMRASAIYGAFPLPDVWPAPGARWMWPTDPAQPAPAGHCFFRANTSGNAPAGRYQFWAVAHDYAEVYLDGVLLLTCDTPGVAQHVEIDMAARPHLITIDAYNAAGRAGVACSLLRVLDTGFYDSGPGLQVGLLDPVPVISSAAGWRCLAYPKRSLRLTPGAVMKQLRYEARKRKAIGDWEFDFDQFHDSAGRPWPDGEVISLKVGMSYLEVLNQLAEDRIDYRAAPGRRRLSMWVKDRGSGRFVGIPWTENSTLESRVETRSAR